MFVLAHKSRIVLLAVSLTVVLPAVAHDAHVHGVASLDITIDKQQVTLQLDSPLANLIGFEHHPKTDKDRQAVRDMASLLRRANGAFTPTPAAQCTLTSVKLASAALPADLLGETVKTDKHAHGHNHQHGTSAVHADLDGTFVFTCANVQQLQYIDVPLMTALKGIDRLNAQIVTQTSQSASTLTASSTRIQLK